MVTTRAQLEKILGVTTQWLADHDPTGPFQQHSSLAAQDNLRRALARRLGIAETMAGVILRECLDEERQTVVAHVLQAPSPAGAVRAAGEALKSRQAATTSAYATIWGGTAREHGDWARRHARKALVGRVTKAGPVDEARDDQGRWTGDVTQDPNYREGDATLMWRTPHLEMAVRVLEPGTLHVLWLGPATRGISPNDDVPPHPGEVRALLRALVSYADKVRATTITAEAANRALAAKLLALGGTVTHVNVTGWSSYPLTSVSVDALRRVTKDEGGDEAGWLEKYSPDQPRVPGGSPEGGEFAGGGFATFFHGTASRDLESIIEHGLLASKSGRTWPGQSKKGTTYVTTSFPEALKWARENADRTSETGGESSTLGLLEVRIPADEMERLHLDENFSGGYGGSTEREFTGDIKPEWIVHAWASRSRTGFKSLGRPAGLEGNPGNRVIPETPEMWRVVKVAPPSDAGAILWVVVLLADDVAKSFDPALHPHEPGGSPEGGQWAETGGGGGGVWTTALAEDFIAARDRSSKMGFLSPLTPGDLVEHGLFMSHGGKVGFALDPEGDVQNVFNNGGPRGSGADAVAEAVARGGRTLDCYDGRLNRFYAQLGFIETGRMTFDPAHAPTGWDYETYDNPDVVFMARLEKGHVSHGDIARAKQPPDDWAPVQRSERRYAGDQRDAAKADSRRAAGARIGRALIRAFVDQAGGESLAGAGAPDGRSASDQRGRSGLRGDVAKYSKDQPRVPGGSPEGGEFASSSFHGGTLYHGTTSNLSAFRPGLAYLAPTHGDASIFASSPILSGSRGGTPRVLSIAAAAGRVKDVNARVEEAVMGDEDVEGVIAMLAVRARDEGFRYLSFSHPGVGDNYMTARVSLYPDEDLRVVGSRVAKAGPPDDVGTLAKTASPDAEAVEKARHAARGPGGQFAPRWDPEAWMRQNLAARVTGIEETTQKQIAKIIADGMRLEETIPDIARRIDRLYLDEIIPNRSRVIAQVEVTHATNWAQDQAALEAADGGLPLEKEWSCVVGTSRVSGVGVSHAARRWYVGPLVELRSLSGRVVTITSQHPVLTGRGWVRADAVHEGDQLVRYGAGVEGQGPRSGIVPDVEDVPPEIAEVFDALLNVRARPGAVGGVMYFDRERGDSEVEVVLVDGKLRRNLEPAGAQGVREVLLELSDLRLGALFAARAGTQSSGGSRDASGFRCHPCESQSLRFNGLLRGADHAGLGLGPEADAREFQRFDGGVSVAAPEREERRAAQVVVDDDAVHDAAARRRFSAHGVAAPDTLFWRHERAAKGAGLGRCAGPYAAAPESRDDASREAPVQTSYRLRGQAASVLFAHDCCVGVKTFLTGGCHVYDYTTATGWMVANGLVVHNSVGDDAVRPDHEEADGQQVPLDQPFEVGGDQLMFPGDGSLGADASNIIGCRCVALYTQAEEA